VVPLSGFWPPGSGSTGWSSFPQSLPLQSSLWRPSDDPNSKPHLPPIVQTFRDNTTW
jgi:hypothetical protein